MKTLCVWLFLSTGLLGPIELIQTTYGGIMGQLETPLGENPVLLQVVYGDCDAGMRPDVSQFNQIEVKVSEHTLESEGTYFEQHPKSDGLNKK